MDGGAPRGYSAQTFGSGSTRGRWRVGALRPGSAGSASAGRAGALRRVRSPWRRGASPLSRRSATPWVPSAARWLAVCS
eukprot:14789275-Alexandrium_andersonii.AAC.1